VDSVVLSASLTANAARLVLVSDRVRKLRSQSRWATRTLSGMFANVHRSEGNHGWIDAAVPEELHLLSQAKGTRRATERCVIAPRMLCRHRARQRRSAPGPAPGDLLDDL
jgi:hypothetical protein